MENWAVKYRPRTFDDVVGQGINTKILESTLDDPYHTLIFHGTSGCGKTTVARIYANALNAHIVEVDAASNNGVDNMRDILDLVRLSPLSNKYRVVILDESHMLSAGAWNAALKAIEEPNASTIWIFCTTEFNKIPRTIVGRSVVFKFRSVKSEIIVERLREILKAEGKELNDTILDLISKNCNGQVRDAVKNLQQCVYAGVETEEQFNKLFGIPDVAGMRAYINSVLSHNPEDGLRVLNKLDVDMYDWKKRLEGLLVEMMHAKFGVAPLKVQGANLGKLLQLTGEFSPRVFGLLLDRLAKITDASDTRNRLITLCLVGVD